MASLRSQWIRGKAQAVKANGGKDPWKQYKIKDQKLGPALDAFQAAAAKFAAFDIKYDRSTATEPQKNQYKSLLEAQEMAAAIAAHRYRNYQIDFETLIKRDQQKENVLKDVLKALEGGFLPFAKATRKTKKLSDLRESADPPTSEQ
jgi:hypothetical protein